MNASMQLAASSTTVVVTVLLPGWCNFPSFSAKELQRQQHRLHSGFHTKIVRKVNQSGGKEPNFCLEIVGNWLAILDRSGPE